MAEERGRTADGEATRAVADVVVVAAGSSSRMAGLDKLTGSLEVGKQADVLVCDVPNYVQLFYHFGVNHVWRVIKRGRVVWAA